MSVTIKLRRDTSANWNSVDPVLAAGEIGIDLTNLTFKIGDGSLHWTALNTYPVMSSETDVSSCSWVIDEDDMLSDLNTKVPTQQSVKAYVSTTSLARANHTGTQLASTISDFATAVATAGATMNADTNISTNAWVLDEDDLSSDSPVKTVTQQSVKAYIDKQIQRIDANINLNTFRIIEQSGLSVHNMVDGFSDSYEDQSGVDLLQSLNQIYLDIDGYYGNVVLYDIPNTSYDVGHDFDMTSILSSATDITFNNDGSKCYVLDESGLIYELDLSTNYDPATATYNSVNKDISATQTLTEGFDFSLNGTKLFVVDQNVRNIGEYVLTVPWDISTLSPTGVTYSINAQDVRPTGIRIREDGIKIYIVGNANDSVYEYDLATSDDLSSISYSSVFHTINSNNVEAFSFNFDGTKMFTLDNNGDFQQYSMVVPYDIANLVYDVITINIVTGTEQPHGLFLKSDGTKMYMVAINENIIKQYSTVKSSTDDITLISENVIALAVPDNCFVVLEDKFIDGILDTDIQIYASRDDGNTWTLGSLSKVCDTNNHRINTAVVDVSTQPSGTDMRYKLTSTNNKKIEFHAISLQWS